MKKYRIIIFSLITLLIITIGASVFILTDKLSSKTSNDSIIVLFTNDTHCAVENDIGFAGVSAYKKEMEENHKYVTLVDCGDAVQGASIGSLTNGDAIIRIMNEVGYDICSFGNHEFDYGIEVLSNILDNAKAKYICANFSYNGSININEKFSPYEIVTYGDEKVAFISVVTPFVTTDCNPKKFMENDDVVCNFANDSNGNGLATIIQNNVNEVRNKGAKYVILLTHLGSDSSDSPYSSFDVASKITGVNVILDAHSHTEMPSTIVSDKDGNNLIIASTGTQLNNIGQLVICPDGTISVSLITDYNKKDENITSLIKDENKNLESILLKEIGSLPFDLSLTDENGIRTVRSKETPIGDLCADALLAYGDADIAMINGGGIRSSLKAGKITYQNAIDVFPFLDNGYAVAEISGSDFLDMLEYFYQYVEKEYAKDGAAICEFGSFMQVSGIKFTINTSIKSSVVSDSNDNLVEVGSTRRISDVFVLKDGTYVPLDSNAKYKVASVNYLLFDGGCGLLNYCARFGKVVNTEDSNWFALRDYLESILENGIDKYKTVDNRITIY